jgi:hypothetical protein
MKTFWCNNKFSLKNKYIRFFLGTKVGKRKLSIFKKRWFDITTLNTFVRKGKKPDSDPEPEPDPYL